MKKRKKKEERKNFYERKSLLNRFTEMNEEFSRSEKIESKQQAASKEIIISLGSNVPLKPIYLRSHIKKKEEKKAAAAESLFPWKLEAVLKSRAASKFNGIDFLSNEILRARIIQFKDEARLIVAVMKMYREIGNVIRGPERSRDPFNF